MPSTLVPSDPTLYRAIYYDGQSAVRHDVWVHLGVAALDIVTPSGDVMDRWFYGEVTFADQGSGGIRIAKVDSEARLVFQDSTAFNAVQARVPAMHAQKKRARNNMYASILATLAFLGAFYLSIPYLTTLIVAMTPLTYEAKLGRSLSATVTNFFTDDKSKGVCSGVAGGMALIKVVDELSQHTRSPFPYEVRVLDVDMVNAMALPGGYIYVFRGLLDKAQGVDELTGILAHEMAHIDLRHPMQAVVRSYGLELVSDMMFGGSTMGSVSGTLMSMSYSRDAEEEADAAAIETLQKAGLDTAGMARFFERFSAKEKQSDFGLPGFLSTHPDTSARSMRARKASQKGRRILSDQEWSDLQEICE